VLLPSLDKFNILVGWQYTPEAAFDGTAYVSVGSEIQECVNASAPSGSGVGWKGKLENKGVERILYMLDLKKGLDSSKAVTFTVNAEKSSDGSWKSLQVAGKIFIRLCNSSNNAICSYEIECPQDMGHKIVLGQLKWADSNLVFDTIGKPCNFETL
jgi:hypothetical protein